MEDEAADLSGEEELAVAAAAEAATATYAGDCARNSSSGCSSCDSGSEDEQLVEEFEMDEQELADTTAQQHEEDGRDLQGIPWDRLQLQRDRYRQQRMQQYHNYMNCIPEDEWEAVRQELTAGWPQPLPLPALHCPYRFLRNWRAVASSIVHFQLRNLLWAVSAHDVYVVYDNRVQHWNSVTRKVGDVLDLRGPPKGPRLPGISRVQVSTMCVANDLLAAGGFSGELVLGRLTRADPGTCWGDDESEDDENESATDVCTAADILPTAQNVQQGGHASAGLEPADAGGQALRTDASALEQQLLSLLQQRCASDNLCDHQQLPLWTASGAGCGIGSAVQGRWDVQQELRAAQVIDAACQQHTAATQYVWSWEHQQQQWRSRLLQQQLLRDNWQQWHPAQRHYQRGKQQQQLLQPQHQWPPLVRLSHDQPPQHEQQQQQLQRHGSAHQQQHSPHEHPQQQQRSPECVQSRRQQHHDEEERLMGAAGPSACEVLHSCRVTQNENGITNGIEIFDSCSYGPCVMTSNNDCCVRLFDVEGCRARQRLEFPFAVNYATMRPDGAGVGGGAVVAVVGDDPLTWLVDCRSGLEVMKLEGHRDFSFAVVWHPNGHLLATGNQDSTTRVWDVRQTSTPVAVLGGSMGAIRSLRFSPDGACLAAAEPADFVHVYDVASNFSKVQEIDLFGEVAGISFSPDAQALFVAISDTLYSSLLQYQRSTPHL